MALAAEAEAAAAARAANAPASSPPNPDITARPAPAHHGGARDSRTPGIPRVAPGRGAPRPPGYPGTRSIPAPARLPPEATEDTRAHRPRQVAQHGEPPPGTRQPGPRLPGGPRYQQQAQLAQRFRQPRSPRAGPAGPGAVAPGAHVAGRPPSTPTAPAGADHGFRAPRRPGVRKRPKWLRPRRSGRGDRGDRRRAGPGAEPRIPQTPAARRADRAAASTPCLALRQRHPDRGRPPARPVPGGDCLTGANMQLNETTPSPKITEAVPCGQATPPRFSTRITISGPRAVPIPA